MDRAYTPNRSITCYLLRLGLIGLVFAFVKECHSRKNQRNDLTSALAYQTHDAFYGLRLDTFLTAC